LKILNPKRPFFKWAFFSALSGILSGIAAAVFLILLDLATKTRDAHLAIIWCLPLAGLGIGWVYHRFGKDIAGGNNLILEQIHQPKNTIPLTMAPFILIGTVVTHLFGGSAGREGTAVQMGASLSDQLSKFFKLDPEERRILLVTGAGAGFGAAIGAPWAGVVFGMEVIQIGHLRFFALIECGIASFCAYSTTLLLRAPHSVYPKPQFEAVSLQSLAWIALAGILFGLTARGFSRFTHQIEILERRFISFPPLKPFLAGIVLVLLYFWEGTYRYAGLGISVIQESFGKISSFKDPALKFVFTAITVGSGFKGGEFIPLVFIGATLGSALAHFMPLSSGVLAAVGFAAVFGAAANTPLACSLMALELFGWQIAPYAVVGCFVGFYFSGHQGIYQSQVIKDHKHKKFLRWMGWFGELPRRFMKTKNQ
jgi:H+/Cl- antiporter ClcA